MNPAAPYSAGLTFGPEVLGEPQDSVVHHRGLEYRGEVIVAESLDTAWGRPLDLDQVESLGRELRAIRETKERYVTARDTETIAVRGSLEDRVVSVQRELARRYAAAYSTGRIYSHPDLSLRPRDVFLQDTPESWADHLVSDVLARSCPELPIDTTDFPAALTVERIGDLYKGLFQGDPESAEVANRYAPGLGLSRQDSPLEFDASRCRVVEAIQAELESRNGEASVEELLRAITIPYGLTRTLASLYLISFVKHAHGEMALGLDEAAAKHITWDLVPGVPFHSLLGSGLGVVRLHPTLAWDTVLPYASLLVEGLESEGGDEQEQHLMDRLRAMEREITTVQLNLDSLRAGLEPAGLKALEVLDRLRPLCAVSDYREFHYEAQRGFGGPSRLNEVLVQYEKVGLLIDLAPDLARAKRYLGLMSFGRTHQDLSLARNALLARIDPEGLLHDPSLWSSIEESFRQVCERYAVAYVAHHGSYNQEALELSHRLERLAPPVVAFLRRFLSARP